MLEIGKKARINLHWKVSPYDFSKERLNRVVAKASKKYGIPKDHISVTPNFIMLNEKGEKVNVTNDIVSNIQDPQFQLKLFKDYLKVNNVTGYDFDLIKRIDSEINSRIDYNVYDKYKRFSVKWVKWSNFLSYGKDNVFDFRNLKGLVLLNGDNQSGKTTFAIDLIHFLLFGKTPKVPTQDKIFNKHLNNETKVEVEGCLNIEGEDYIIKRTLTRPSADRRTEKSKTTQKVEYYKIVGENKEELVEYIDNQQEENSIQTNKKIKEAIGREDDFDLVMSITESNLDALIEKKDTERGRLLSRWIGLMPLEEKDALAREQFNQNVKPYLISNRYDIETLKNEIGSFNISIKQNEQANKEFEKKNAEIDKEIENYENIRKVLLSSKSNVDETLLKLDITTLEAKIENIKNAGILKKNQLENAVEEIKKLGSIDFSMENYEKLNKELNDLSGERAKFAEQFKSIKKNIEYLQKSEYCPTCGRKLENIDNTDKISELNGELKDVVQKGKETSEKIEFLEKEILSEKEKMDKYNLFNKLTMEKSALEINIERLRNEIRDLIATKNEYQKNSETIDKNNKLDIEIRNNEILINGKRRAKENNLSWISQNSAKNSEYKDRIAEREEVITKIQGEEILVRNWKIYLDMVGKNGISKMVLRKTLPIINARLSQLLSDVCDFDVEVGINNKNDVMFTLIKDGVASDLSSGSGFERTCASLALRFVLADISSISKSNFTLLDEVLGRVAKYNLDNIHKLFDKILTGYDFILHVCHLDEAKDWSKMQVNVTKKDNISEISVINGTN